MNYEPTAHLRFVEREHEAPVGDGLFEVRMVRVPQQPWLDGWGNPFCQDVPLEDQASR